MTPFIHGSILPHSDSAAPLFGHFACGYSPRGANGPTAIPCLDAAMAASETVTMEGISLPRDDSHQTGGPRLILLRYGKQEARNATIPAIQKVTAHFDVKGVQPASPYCFHTDFAGKPRRLDSPLLQGLPFLQTSHRNGVPELWTSVSWAKEFGQFLFRLVENSEPPDAIEIHPPFTCSIRSIDDFLNVYEAFEASVLERFPDCEFLVENRSGSNHPSPFLVSRVDSIVALGQALATRNLRLRIALDLPQLFTATWGSKHSVGMEGLDLIKRLEPIREQIRSLHLWGRGPNGGAHSGSLDGLFDAGTGAKEACLGELCRMFNDGCPDRQLVLEVTRRGDMEDILRDLEAAGFEIR